MKVPVRRWRCEVSRELWEQCNSLEHEQEFLQSLGGHFFSERFLQCLSANGEC